MHKKKLILPAITSALVLTACAGSPNTDFLRVVPVKYVAPPAADDKTPNATYGWLPVSQGDEDAYSVELGSKQYDVLWSKRATQYKNVYQAANALAEKELRDRGLCISGVPRLIGPITGTQDGTEVSFLVECVKP